MTSVQHWTSDGIDVALAAELEGSLSCLGIELGTENFDMSAPLHSLIQSVSTADYCVNQDNGDDTFPQNETIRSILRIQPKKNRLALSADEDMSSAIKRFCVSSEDKENDNSQSSRCRHSSSVPDLRTTGSPTIPVDPTLSPNMLSQMLQISESSQSLSMRDAPLASLKNTGFQFVLGAATSMATKINEETMTYLNQGQSYEIKLKKLGDLTEMRGKLLKSIIRVGFQERRLQYSEKEQISLWQNEKFGERILEIDIPLSYGIYDVVNDQNNIHICEFLWDPTNETGVFIKVNCISTEFTPKKHGGEKGVPFRIQIETFSDSDSYTHRLHVAACQVKVFKPKGADRKHKTDRDKMNKRSHSEQDKYKTSYDCTVMAESTHDPLYLTAVQSPPPSQSSNSTFSPKIKTTDSKTGILNYNTLKYERSKSESFENSDLSGHSQDKSASTDSFEMCSDVRVKEEEDNINISVDSTRIDISNWLRKHRFTDQLEVFVDYNGLDMLRLSQDDFTRICGLASGVRLYNALHCRPVVAKKAVYARLANEEVFQAVYLYELTASYLKKKLSLVFSIPLENVQDVHLQTGSSATYTATDEVIANMKDDSLFTLEVILYEHVCDKCFILLKPCKDLAF